MDNACFVDDFLVDGDVGLVRTFRITGAEASLKHHLDEIIAV